MKEKKSLHFLIVGHEGCHNRGCEALVRTTIDVLKEQFTDDIMVTVASLYPEHEFPICDIPGVNVLPGYSGFNRKFSKSITRKVKNLTVSKLIKALLPYGIIKVLMFGKNKVKLSNPSCRPIKEEEFSQVWHLKQVMLEADAVISIGGDMFIEDYGPPIYAMESIEYAQFLGRKTIIWGASIWPLKVKWIEKRVQELLLKADLVTVRDDPTVQYLSSLGITNNVVRVSDGAFLMKPQAPEKEQFPRGTNKNSKTIGFNGSNLMFYYLSFHKSQEVIKELVNFFKVLIDKLGHNIVLIPHDGYPGAAERNFLYSFSQLVNRPGNTYLIPVGLNAKEIKGVIGLLEAFITMRFHPSIAALSQGVPTIGMSHSPKFAGMHKSVYGHTNYLVSYENISQKYLMKKFNEIWNDRDKIKRQLMARIPSLKEEAKLGGKKLKELLSMK